MIKMLVAGDELSFDIDQELVINDNDLISELREHSSRLAWWQTRVAYKQEEYAQIRTLVESNLAGLSLAVRKELEDAGGRVTESMVESHTKASPEYIEFNDQLAATKCELDVLRSIAKGFQDRTSMLTMAAALQNAETKSFVGGGTA